MCSPRDNAVISSRVGELIKVACAWASQRPLMSVRPLPSITEAPCNVSGASLLPTLTIRFPLMSTSPRYGAEPVESMILTSTNATLVSSLPDLISTLGTFRRWSALAWWSNQLDVLLVNGRIFTKSTPRKEGWLGSHGSPSPFTFTGLGVFRGVLGAIILSAVSTMGGDSLGH